MTEDSVKPINAGHYAALDVRRDRSSSDDGILLWIGVALTFGGVLALIFPVATTMAIQIIIGGTFMISGSLLAAFSFSIRNTGPFFGALAIALLTIAAGMFFVFNSAAGALVLTIMIATLFTLHGLSELHIAFLLYKRKGWLWFLGSGSLSLIVAVLIAAGLPGASAVLLGLLVGVHYTSTGIALIIFSRSISN